MGIGIIRRLSAGVVPVIALSIFLLISLDLLSDATENSLQSGHLYTFLLIANVVGLILLFSAIGVNLMRLIRQYRNEVTGSRLTVKLMLFFSLLSILPVFVVYHHSVSFLQQGIDNWFDVDVQHALQSALELSRVSLEPSMNAKLEETELIGRQLREFNEVEHKKSTLQSMEAEKQAFDYFLFKRNGDVIAVSEKLSDTALALPSEAVLAQVSFANSYVSLEPIEGRIFIRTLAVVSADQERSKELILQLLFPLDSRSSELASAVQETYSDYEALAFFRESLKFAFTITLSLVLLLTLFFSTWAAFYFARRLVSPIRMLAIGTRAVAKGNYHKRLPMSSKDELGFLVQSFNDMTERIAQSSEEALQSQIHAQREHAYLQAVLAHLSSGVLALDRQGHLRSINHAAIEILGPQLQTCLGEPFSSIEKNIPVLKDFVAKIKPFIEREEEEWQLELSIAGRPVYQQLLCRGAFLSSLSGGEAGGHVIVFDDVTELIQVQRDAAWGEVARRLAHEIKNPLTPIQLSAERLRHKYLKTMSEKDASVLDRATHTIVQQVEVMKEMVKAFSEYARAPVMSLKTLDMNKLLEEILDMYIDDRGQVKIEKHFDSSLPKVRGDAGRIRQLVHNIIKNAVESCDQQRESIVIRVATKQLEIDGRRGIEFSFHDNGPGIPQNVLPTVFDPYVTSKKKGSGLGLAIVKKIVEEHRGVIWAENVSTGGAKINIRIPCQDEQSEERQTGLSHKALLRAAQTEERQE